MKLRNRLITSLLCQSSIVLLFSFLTCGICLAQDDTDDIITWSSLALNMKPSAKTSFTIKPTHRRFQNLKANQNSSIDFVLGYKMNKNWSGSLLHRTWFMPSADMRHFLFVDIKHQTANTGKWIFRNGVRWHKAWDVNIVDPDFLRWKPLISYDIAKRLRVFISNDWFFRLNSQNEWQRVRYEAGFNYSFDSSTSINVQYWNEQTLNQEVKRVNHIFNTTLQHRI